MGKNVANAKSNCATNFEIRDAPVAHPELDGSRRDAEIYRDLRLFLQRLGRSYFQFSSCIHISHSLVSTPVVRDPAELARQVSRPSVSEPGPRLFFETNWKFNLGTR